LDYKKKSDSNTCYVIQISAGEVINCLEDGSDDVTTVDTSSIIDSDEAQKIAADYGLEPGESWPIGYDFQLEVNTFGDDEKEYTMLTVYGQHEDCSFAKVILNANTGEILRASQKVQNEDGSGDWITW
jgi:Tfp pilus assembly protein PilW